MRGEQTPNHSPRPGYLTPLRDSETQEVVCQPLTQGVIWLPVTDSGKPRRGSLSLSLFSRGAVRQRYYRGTSLIRNPDLCRFGRVARGWCALSPPPHPSHPLSHTHTHTSHLTHTHTPLQIRASRAGVVCAVKSDSIRKILARAADTGHSD